MIHIWSVLCKNSIVDQSTNNISLINALEKITVSIPKGLSKKKELRIPFSFDLVSLWSKKEGEKKRVNKLNIRIDLYGTRKKGRRKIFRKNIIGLKDKKRVRTIIQIGGIVVKTSGNYWLDIKQEKEGRFISVAKIPLEIELKYSSKT